MVEKRICTSCNDDVHATGKSVEFKCPACEELIRRCGKCRKLMLKYKCKCGFIGP